VTKPDETLPMHFDSDAAPVLPQRPRSVTAAGFIWIAVGSLILLVLPLLVLMAFLVVGREQFAGVLIGSVVAALFSALIAGVFLFVGIQTLRGTARDTLGNGIGSIIFGCLSLLSCAVRIATGDLLRGVVSLIWACMFLTAGILALVGRAEYRDWRNAKQRALSDQT
jgi:hypothetical protein